MSTPRAFLLSLCLTSIFLFVTPADLGAQTFTILAGFDQTNGDMPVGSLLQGLDGNFYGNTEKGGSGGQCDYNNPYCGVVFKVTSTGTISVVYNFCTQSSCPNGWQPQSSLALATDGTFYGTTGVGGANDGCGLVGCGTVFKVSRAGLLKTLYSFCSQTNCEDGETPLAGLVLANDGSFYGTTPSGGMFKGQFCPNGCGTVFKITPTGAFTTLHSFCAQVNCADGAGPVGNLVQGSDGNLYGTTGTGGLSGCPSGGCGTVYKIAPTGEFTVIHQFTSTGGPHSPVGGLVLGTDGNFYGTATRGGINNKGSVFKITPSGTLTSLHAFCGTISPCTDGASPTAGLVQASDHNFYGTTSTGGSCNGGTIFTVTSSGKFNSLYSFCSEGGPPNWLVQGTNGVFYGTEANGNNYEYGTVFSFSNGLPLFVQALPNHGRAGSTIKILGTGLAHTSKVTFNGVPASFTVSSTSFLTVVVPAAASTGLIEVTTPNGSLSSIQPFNVP